MQNVQLFTCLQRLKIWESQGHAVAEVYNGLVEVAA
jgi:hypothetical protein